MSNETTIAQFVELGNEIAFSEELKKMLLFQLRSKDNLVVRNELFTILEKSKIEIPKMADAMYQAGFWYCSRNHSSDLKDNEFQDRKEDLIDTVPLFKIVFAVMEFIYQVDNGGIAQWVDNGYCLDYRTLKDFADENHMHGFVEMLEDLYYHLDHEVIDSGERSRINGYWRKVRDLNSEEIEEIQCPRLELEGIEKSIPKDLESILDEYLFNKFEMINATVSAHVAPFEGTYADYISKFDPVPSNWMFVAAWFVVHPNDCA